MNLNVFYDSVLSLPEAEELEYVNMCTSEQ